MRLLLDIFPGGPRLGFYDHNDDADIILSTFYLTNGTRLKAGLNIYGPVRIKDEAYFTGYKRPEWASLDVSADARSSAGSRHHRQGRLFSYLLPPSCDARYPTTRGRGPLRSARPSSHAPRRPDQLTDLAKSTGGK